MVERGQLELLCNEIPITMQEGYAFLAQTDAKSRTLEVKTKAGLHTALASASPLRLPGEAYAVYGQLRS
jgi:hypothetical protein